MTLYDDKNRKFHNDISRNIRDVVLISFTYHSKKLEPRFCPGSIPARGVWQASNGENLQH